MTPEGVLVSYAHEDADWRDSPLVNSRQPVPRLDR
jgi:hypothetical protein